MKNIYFISIFLVFCFNVFSQERKNIYELVGALTTNNQGVISYKVHLEEIDNGQLKGVSITDFYGENITKAKVVGTINHKKQLISFKEVSNISTKSTADEKLFCFISTHNLKMRVVKDQTIINGDFTGTYSNGDICANGQIYLVSATIIDDITAMVDSLDSNNDTVKKIKSMLQTAKSPVIENQVVNGNNKLSIDWESDHIVFDVWDGNNEDNDMINIYFNGKLIEENLVIKNQKRTIDIPFNGQKGIIRIFAVNEGYEPPNTVNFMLHNGTNSKPFLSSLRKGEAFTIEFNRKPQ